MNIDKGTIIAGTVAIIVLYLFVKGEVKTAAAAVGTAINPTSDKNLAYQGVNGLGAAITGNSKFDMGSSIYDWFHPNEGASLNTPINKGTTKNK